VDKLQRKLDHKTNELDMLQVANEALQAQAKARRRPRSSSAISSATSQRRKNPIRARRSSHWSPYDRVRVVNFIP
jgi:hypothetical protein